LWLLHYREEIESLALALAPCLLVFRRGAGADTKYNKEKIKAGFEEHGGRLSKENLNYFPCSNRVSSPVHAGRTLDVSA
jgi:hypothetical protein